MPFTRGWYSSATTTTIILTIHLAAFPAQSQKLNCQKDGTLFTALDLMRLK
jgi:hypothetical protein